MAATGADSGRTLVEFMVALLVLAVLLAIAIPSFVSATRSADDRAARSILDTALVHTKVQFQKIGQLYVTSATLVSTLSAVELSLASQSTASTGQNQVSVSTAGDGSAWCWRCTRRRRRTAAPSSTRRRSPTEPPLPSGRSAPRRPRPKRRSLPRRPRPRRCRRRSRSRSSDPRTPRSIRPPPGRSQRATVSPVRRMPTPRRPTCTPSHPFRPSDGEPHVRIADRSMPLKATCRGVVIPRRAPRGQDAFRS